MKIKTKPSIILSSSTTQKTITITMAALIEALDQQFQAGENGHIELAWSKSDLEETICQFHFQCVRTSTPEALQDLADVLHDMLQKLFDVSSMVDESEPSKTFKRVLLTQLYRMIGQTRDVEGGKGEYTLAYMMIYEWSKFNMELAKFALKCFVKIEGESVSEEVRPYGQEVADIRPYGSWKDIKYMCDYVKTKLGSDQDAVQHPLVQYAIELVTEQLRLDEAMYGEVVMLLVPPQKHQNLSLLTKWIPREGDRTGRFAWLYPALSAAYFPHYIESAKACLANPKTDQMKRATVLERAQNKCNTQYRMLIAKLNRHLDTVQIKMCGKRWAEIDHHKTTSITMQRGRKAFMNLPNKKKTQEQDQVQDQDQDQVQHQDQGEVQEQEEQKERLAAANRRSQDPDRIKCAENMQEYMKELVAKGKEVKGKNIGLECFGRDAMNLYSRSVYGHQVESEGLEQEKAVLNSQWRDNCAKKNASALENFIAMVDLSGSMRSPTSDPYFAAVTLGCRVAEKSTLGKRVMGFASTPKWINLEGTETLTDMTDRIYASSEGQGMSTNFYNALDLILTAIVEKQLSADVVSNMVLAIFSDMQINECIQYENCGYGDKTKPWSTMYDVIKQKYHDTGIKVCGVPYQAPHILFWNLRKTNGFPTLSTQQNASMMSGFDPSVLELFCEEGMAGLQGVTALSMLYKVLANKRYDVLEEAASRLLL